MTNTRNKITNGLLHLQCKNLAIFAETVFPETCLTTTSAIFCHFFGFHNIFIFLMAFSEPNVITAEALFPIPFSN